MIQVKLLGELGELFGTDWNCADNSMRDVFKLIECQTEGFSKKLEEYFENNIGLEIVHGKDLLMKTEDDIHNMVLPLLKDTVFITPTPAGSGKATDAVLMIAAGIALYFTAGAIAGALTGSGGAVGGAGAGAGIGINAGGEAVRQTVVRSAGLGKNYFKVKAAIQAIGGLVAYAGITKYMAPDVDNSPDSYLFGNSEENVKQGSPVPLCYGEVIVPGVPINVAFVPYKMNRATYNFAMGGEPPANSLGDMSERVSEGTTGNTGELG
jgi:predicted phage tail protein